MRRLVLAVFAALSVSAAAACDPCAAAMELHEHRCASGDAASCEWIQAHGGNTEAPVCG